MQDFNFWKEELLQLRCLIENDVEETTAKLLALIWPKDEDSYDLCRSKYAYGAGVPCSNWWVYYHKIEPEVTNLPTILASKLYALYTSTEITCQPSPIQLYPLCH